MVKADPKSMIVADNIWPNFLRDAKVYEASNEVYLSPQNQGKYKISSTVKEVIHIDRINVPGSGETIGIRKFRTAIQRINNKIGTRIQKGKIYEHVAEEVTLVELLPFLDWDETGHYILTQGLLAPNLENSVLDEAPDDNPDSRVQTNVRQRLGQKKFRDKLFSVYNGTCVISSCSVKEVLHVCHLNPHSGSGINHSTNGITLRSDLHDLFDQNLIAIEPETLTVKISETLRNTDYYQYHDHPLNNRNDDKRPSFEALQQRWAIFNEN